MEFFRQAATAVRRRAAPTAEPVGVYEPGDRLLGAAEPVRDSVGDYLAAVGAGGLRGASTKGFYRSVRAIEAIELSTRRRTGLIGKCAIDFIRNRNQ